VVTQPSSTTTLDLTEAGEDTDEIAAAFDLEPEGVRWALAYENSARAA